MALAALSAVIKMGGAREAISELGSLKSAIGSASGAFGALGPVVNLVESGLKAAAVAMAAAAAGAAILGKNASDAHAELDGLVRGLATVSTGPEDLMAQLGRLREVAKLPGLGFTEAAQGSLNLQAAGLSASLAERSLMAFGNALASAGKGKAELEGVITALSQISSKGKISAEEINQIAERVPQIRLALAGAFGTADTESIQKMGIGATESIARLVAELEKLPRASGGVKNLFENFQQGAKDALSTLGQGVNEMLMSLAPLGESLLGGLQEAARSAAEVISAIGRSGVIQEVAQSLGKAFQNAFGGVSFRDLAIEMVAGIASAIATLPGFLSAVWQNLKALFEDGRMYLAMFIAEIGALGAGFQTAIAAIGQKGIFGIPAALQSMQDAFANYKVAGGAAAAMFARQTSYTDIPNLFGRREEFAKQIREQLQPLAALPSDLNFGGPKSLGEATTPESLFAAWDKHLAKIEANTRQTAAALLSARVAGGGALAKAGLSAGERLGAPDPFTRPVSSDLERGISRIQRKNARQARSDAALYGLR